MLEINKHFLIYEQVLKTHPSYVHLITIAWYCVTTQKKTRGGMLET